MRDFDLERAFDTADDYATPEYCSYGTCVLSPSDDERYCTAHLRTKENAR